MRRFGKLAAFVTMLAAALAVGVVALAEEPPTYSIIVEHPAANDAYTAYKIFDVSYATDADGKNTGAYAYTIEKTVNENGDATGWWAEVLAYMRTEDTPATETDGVYSGNGLKLTKAPGTESTYVVEEYTIGGGSFSAPKFAEFLATKTSDKEASAPPQSGTPHDDGSIAPVTLSLSGPGYYLVTCKGTTDGVHTTALAELTTAAPTVTIHDKNVAPDFEKKQSDTVSQSYAADPLNVQIGDTVYYQITSTVPDLTGYAAYTFEVSDIMSEGLTLNMDATKPDVTIKVGGAEVNWPVSAIKGSYNEDGKATEDETETNVIGFRVSANLAAEGYNRGTPIEITYSATVNEKAIGDVEDNTATLAYSNDPNSESTGTVTRTTKVYDANIAVLKYDAQGDDNNNNVKEDTETWTYLADAQFVLYRWAVSIADGAPSFTTTDVDGATISVTESTEGAEKVYYRYDIATTDSAARVSWTTDQKQATVLTTGDNGQLTDPTTNTGLTSFAGLEDGAYYLLETAAPDGYNLLAKPVEVVISSTVDATSGAITVGSQVVNVANESGSLLPSTGGRGTAVFYVLGGVLVIGSAVLLVTRRRTRGGK